MPAGVTGGPGRAKERGCPATCRQSPARRLVGPGMAGEPPGSTRERGGGAGVLPGLGPKGPPCPSILSPTPWHLAAGPKGMAAEPSPRAGAESGLAEAVPRRRAHGEGLVFFPAIVGSAVLSALRLCSLSSPPTTQSSDCAAALAALAAEPLPLQKTRDRRNSSATSEERWGGGPFPCGSGLSAVFRCRAAVSPWLPPRQLVSVASRPFSGGHAVWSPWHGQRGYLPTQRGFWGGNGGEQQGHSWVVAFGPGRGLGGSLQCPVCQ